MQSISRQPGKALRYGCPAEKEVVVLRGRNHSHARQIRRVENSPNGEVVSQARRMSHQVAYPPSAPFSLRDVMGETHAEDPKITSLPGYRAYARPPSARTCGKGAAQGVCTFVRKGITSVGKDEILNYKDSAIEANVTEIIIAGKKGRGKNKASTTVYIANVYSNPQHGNQRFKTLLHKIRDAAHGSGAAAVVCGDFNAPHEELGLVVYPLPKNMGPGESEGRRAARARALLLQHQNDEGAVYVDVAKVKNKDAYVAAAVAATTGKIVTSCSVRTRSASQAEEMAIALAARSPGVRTILSDSKTAIRSFSRGAIPADMRLNTSWNYQGRPQRHGYAAADAMLAERTATPPAAPRAMRTAPSPFIKSESQTVRTGLRTSARCLFPRLAKAAVHADFNAVRLMAETCSEILNGAAPAPDRSIDAPAASSWARLYQGYTYGRSQKAEKHPEKQNVQTMRARMTPRKRVPHAPILRRAGGTRHAKVDAPARFEAMRRAIESERVSFVHPPHSRRQQTTQLFRRLGGEDIARH
ncbi:hypothetical protein MRX96_044886 [Rhipicephalus microplus]